MHSPVLATGLVGLASVLVPVVVMVMAVVPSVAPVGLGVVASVLALVMPTRAGAAAAVREAGAAAVRTAGVVAREVAASRGCAHTLTICPSCGGGVGDEAPAANSHHPAVSCVAPPVAAAASVCSDGWHDNGALLPTSSAHLNT